jgi:predicted dehydrogenase
VKVEPREVSRMTLGVLSNDLIDESLLQAIEEHESWTLSGIIVNKTNHHQDGITKDELIQHSDAIYLTADYPDVYQTASNLIKTGKHIYLASMASFETAQVDELLRQCREANLNACTGTYTHSHPTFRTLVSLQPQASIIELHRQYPFPNTESWRMFLYEDLAIVLSLIQSEIKRISASSLAMLRNETDLIDIRLEFTNGQAAHLQINLSGHTQRHKLFLYERGRRVSLDFIKNSLRIGHQSVAEEHLHPTWHNPYSTQLHAFYQYIHHQAPALLSLQTVHTLLSTLTRIEEKINS